MDFATEAPERIVVDAVFASDGFSDWREVDR